MIRNAARAIPRHMPTRVVQPRSFHSTSSTLPVQGTHNNKLKVDEVISKPKEQASTSNANNSQPTPTASKTSTKTTESPFKNPTINTGKKRYIPKYLYLDL